MSPISVNGMHYTWNCCHSAISQVPTVIHAVSYGLELFPNFILRELSIAIEDRIVLNFSTHQNVAN